MQLQLICSGPNLNLTQGHLCSVLLDPQVATVSTREDDLEWAALRHIDGAAYQVIRTEAVPVVPKINFDSRETFSAAVIAIIQLDTCERPCSPKVDSPEGRCSRAPGIVATLCPTQVCGRDDAINGLVIAIAPGIPLSWLVRKIQ